MNSTNKDYLRYLHVMTLWTLAVSQPVLDILARHAEYFVSRYIVPHEIIILTLTLCYWLPVCLLGLMILGKHLSDKLDKIIYSFLLGLLTTSLLLQYLLPLNRLIPGVILILFSIAITVFILRLYFSNQIIPRMITIMSVALIIIPINFLFFSPVKSYFKTSETHFTEQAIKTEINKNTLPNILFIVFDELPLVTLLNKDGRIDPVRYPNFHRLAENATWYRNATTVGAFTHRSLTAIVTGNKPVGEGYKRLPTDDDVPENIFTYLAPIYDLHVNEYISMFCPKEICGYSFPGRQTCSVIVDMSIVYLHLILPTEFKQNLPDIDKQWGNFIETPEFCLNFLIWGDAGMGPNRAERFYNFIETIGAEQNGNLYFIHTNLPHMPWKYLPSGKSSKHVEDPYLRHLLQVGFADTLLGKTLDKLEQYDWYDSSLIIVTADHGISFASKTSDRRLDNKKDERDYQDIISIPLLVKKPNQQNSVINDDNVETIDILPTIADLLDYPLSWQAAGSSTVTEFTPREQKIIFDKVGRRYTTPAQLPVMSIGLERKLELYGSDTPLMELQEQQRTH